MMIRKKLIQIYDLMFARFGPQHWWPGQSRFEIIVGAVLTQNTNWQNVEKAINNLKNAGVMDAQKLHRMPVEQLAELIRPAGYFNVKAKRLKNLLNWLFESHAGDVDLPARFNKDSLREELLAINGIGRETAD